MLAAAHHGNPAPPPPILKGRPQIPSINSCPPADGIQSLEATRRQPLSGRQPLDSSLPRFSTAARRLPPVRVVRMSADGLPTAILPNLSGKAAHRRPPTTTTATTGLPADSSPPTKHRCIQWRRKLFFGWGCKYFPRAPR